MKRILTVVLGVLCILVGIAGLFLPILQGWAFIFMGLALISPRLAGRLRRQVTRRLFKKDIVFLNDWKKSGVEAGFTTRHFPLVLHKTDDLLDDINKKQFVFLLNDRGKGKKRGVCSRFALLNQVHGDGIAVLDDPARYANDGIHHFPDCDAALTNLEGMSLLVFTADCLSVFLCAGDWVGLVHAGWRGSKKKIVQKAAVLLSQRSGVGPDKIKVILGPCIGPRHYEVGPEFRLEFPESSLEDRDGKLYFNLAKENERQLREAGVLAVNISDHGACTFSEQKNFYSFRRERGSAGRMVSFIGRYSSETPEVPT